jgi:hypothetical protein
MSIGSIGGTSALNQAYLSQQAQAVLAQSFDPQTAASSSAAASGGTDASSNALTGTGAATLDSQTLQALMDMTQQDPAADPSGAGSIGQTGQTDQTGQVGGAHHHHHHHGGGTMQAQGSGSSASPTATDTVSSTDAFGVPATDTDGSEDPLAAALSLV